jgi:hypothetical protein
MLNYISKKKIRKESEIRMNKNFYIIIIGIRLKKNKLLDGKLIF